MQRRIDSGILAILTLGLVLLTAAPCGADFMNGSFEQDSWAPGWYKNVTPTGWTMGINNGYMHGVHTLPKTSINASFGPTPFGTQFIELDGDGRQCNCCAGHSWVEQMLPLSINKIHRLTFAVASEQYGNANQLSSWVTVTGSWPGG